MERILLVLFLIFPVTSLSGPRTVDDIILDIKRAAVYESVEPTLLLAVCHVEGSFKNHPPRMDGHTNSYGVCQVKLETALWMDSLYKNETKATEERLNRPYVNARYAAQYLKYQYKQYNNWALAIDAYNKGTAVSAKSEYVKEVIKRLSYVRSHLGNNHGK